MRLLHLVDPGSLGGGGTTLRLVADLVLRQPSVDHVVVVMGSRRHVELARRCGLRPVGSLRGPTLGGGWSARPLARALAALERDGGAFDLVHAWSLSSAVAAGRAAAHHPRLATISVGPAADLATFDAARRLRADGTRFTATSVAVANEIAAMGIDAERVAVLPAAVAPDADLPVEPAALRRSMRARWNADEDDFVVGLLAEPLARGDARFAADVAARVAACDRPVRVVVHPASRRRVEAERWIRRVRLGDLLVVDDDLAEPWRVVHAFDAVLGAGGGTTALDAADLAGPWRVLTGGVRRTRPMPGLTPLLWAMSAGVPVIAEETAAVREVVEEGVSGLLVPPNDTSECADRILRLIDDRTIGGRLAAAARTVVNRRHHASAWSVRMRSVHEQVVERRRFDVDEAIRGEHEPQAA